MKRSAVSNQKVSAFTIVELMVVISVIAIMAGLAISAFSNASQDTRRITARQQQVAVQNAINAWVNARSTGRDQATGKMNGITGTRSAYNAAATSLGRLNLVKGYLDDATFSHFTKYTSNTNQVSSSALSKTKQHLNLSTWSASSYPKVELKDN